jgi:hypothetical protein
MPQKISMFISNGNPIQYQPKNVNMSPMGTPRVPAPSSALTAPIISRIHNVQPGCGSCGRK